MTSSVDKAIKLANDFGWRVFPANLKNKRPLISGWQERATSDPDGIRELFTPFPNAMIGLPTGPINKITVVDLDKKNEVDGFKTVMSLGIRMPTSAIAFTPSGGFHLYYSTQSDEYPCSAGKIGPGVDIRGVGGYVIAPGSISSTGEYRWKNDLHKTKYGILPLTVDLKQVINGKHQHSKKKPFSPSRILEPVMEGQRNDEMTRRCGVLFKRGYSAEQVEGMLDRINHRCCIPPLGDREIHSIFRSIAKREGR
jgi:hypothetical protein